MFRHQNRNENLLYLALWGLIFITPIVSLYVRSLTDSDIQFQFSIILNVWKVYGFFFVIFLIHNFILAPQLVYNKRYLLYGCCMLILLGAVCLFSCHSATGNHPRPGEGMDGMEPMELVKPDHKPDFKPDDMPLGEHDPFMEEGRGPKPDEEHGVQENVSPDKKKTNVHFDKKDQRAFEKMRGQRQGTPPMVGEIDILLFFILVLMIVVNVMVKYYTKSVSDNKRNIIIERDTLEHQLQYLKNQINPHFFMNTLNNIHALVDIDTEQAKVTIEQLSKMMRYVLYDSNNKLTPLSGEIKFMYNYIELMRIRYSNTVDITLNFDEVDSAVLVPPMIFVTFIENAFKHGVSYKKKSFIDVSLTTKNDKIVFCCKNSKISDDNSHHGMIGIQNTVKRLDLIYGPEYSLKFHDDAEVYEVNLSMKIIRERDEV